MTDDIAILTNLSQKADALMKQFLYIANPPEEAELFLEKYKNFDLRKKWRLAAYVAHAINIKNKRYAMIINEYLYADNEELEAISFPKAREEAEWINRSIGTQLFEIFSNEENAPEICLCGNDHIIIREFLKHHETIQ